MTARPAGQQGARLKQWLVSILASAWVLLCFYVGGWEPERGFLSGYVLFCTSAAFAMVYSLPNWREP